MKRRSTVIRPFIPDSDVEGILRWNGKEGSEPAGTVKHAQFYLNGQTFMVMDNAMNHKFGFNEAISFVVNCETADEVDYYWEKLKKGGDPNAQQCGWLKDKFGVSWQVVPTELFEMLKMKKLDLGELREAYTQ